MTLRERLTEADRRVSRMEARRAEKTEQLEALVKELAHLERESDLLEKTEQTLLHISTKILGQSTGLIEKLVTAGLHLVFEDQKLEFRTQTEKYRGKTAVKFQLLEDGRTAPLMDAYGGGVLVVVGVLLRATTIMILGLRRILFLDETLSHLSEQYVDNASRLLRKLCDELDFDVVLVTHQPEFAAHANYHYQAERKGNAAVFMREADQSVPG